MERVETQIIDPISGGKDLEIHTRGPKGSRHEPSHLHHPLWGEGTRSSSMGRGSPFIIFRGDVTRSRRRSLDNESPRDPLVSQRLVRRPEPGPNTNDPQASEPILLTTPLARTSKSGARPIHARPGGRPLSGEPEVERPPFARRAHPYLRGGDPSFPWVISKAFMGRFPSWVGHRHPLIV